MKKDQASDPDVLRRKAEERLRQRLAVHPEAPLEHDVPRLLHELRVHEVELEMQNAELRRARDETEELLQQYTELYDFAPVGYASIDRTGTILSINFSGAEMLGEPRSHLVGKRFDRYLAVCRPSFRELLDTAFACEGRQSGEAALRPKGGRTLQVRLEAQVSEPREECRLVLLDITETRQKDYLLMAQNRLAAMGEMVNSIAHQWRNPLNMLGLLVQELPLIWDAGRLERKSLTSFVGKAMATIDHMSQTIDDFKNYYKPDKAKVRFRVHETVKRTLLLLEPVLAGKKIAISVVEKEERYLEGTVNEFQQALLNIVSNAIDAFRDKLIQEPKIAITIGAEGGKTLVTVADNAGGVPDSIINDIFSPYVTTKGDKGTGLGLYLAKAIIEKGMGGILSVHNVSGGAEFRIEI